MSPLQNIVLMVLNAFLTPLLGSSAKKWGFAIERATLERVLEALQRRSPRVMASEREISAWRERVIHQRKSL